MFKLSKRGRAIFGERNTIWCNKASHNNNSQRSDGSDDFIPIQPPSPLPLVLDRSLAISKKYPDLHMAMRGKHSGKTLPAVQVFDQEVAGSMKTSQLVGFWNVSFLVQFILHLLGYSCTIP